MSVLSRYMSSVENMMPNLRAQARTSPFATPESPTRTPLSRRHRRDTDTEDDLYYPMPPCGQPECQEQEEDVFQSLASHLHSLSPRTMKRRKLHARDVCQLYGLEEGTLDKFADVCISHLHPLLAIDPSFEA